MKLIRAALLLLVASSCAGAQSAASGGGNPTTGTGAGPGTPGGTGTAGSTGSVDAGGPPLPPEMEAESSYEVPVATGSYIWAANPDSGRGAYVPCAAEAAGACAGPAAGGSVTPLGQAGAPRVTGRVPLTGGPAAGAGTRGVSIPPHGRLALVRREGSASLGIVDLSAGTVGSIVLS